MAPKEGHMQAMHRVFGYLRQMPKGRILIDTSQPVIRQEIDVTKIYD
jgi:hypothetical protein